MTQITLSKNLAFAKFLLFTTADFVAFMTFLSKKFVENMYYQLLTASVS